MSPASLPNYEGDSTKIVSFVTSNMMQISGDNISLPYHHVHARMSFPPPNTGVPEDTDINRHEALAHGQSMRLPDPPTELEHRLVQPFDGYGLHRFNTHLGELQQLPLAFAGELVLMSHGYRREVTHGRTGSRSLARVPPCSGTKIFMGKPPPSRSSPPTSTITSRLRFGTRRGTS